MSAEDLYDPWAQLVKTLVKKNFAWIHTQCPNAQMLFGTICSLNQIVWSCTGKGKMFGLMEVLKVKKVHTHKLFMEVQKIQKIDTQKLV